MSHDEKSDAFFRRLVDKAAGQRVPGLFAAGRPGALYQVVDREGVSVIVLPTNRLSHDELIEIMRYRLAQYVVLGYVNLPMVYESGLEYEPLTNVAPDDVHAIAGSAATGEILCYLLIKAPPDAPRGTTLRMQDRPLFPSEQIFGWGVFNRLLILPDLPIAHLRELERFVKNQQRKSLDDLAARAPAECTLGVFRALIGPLSPYVQACLADVEEGVKAKKVLDFLHVPCPIIHGVVPYVAPDEYPFPSYQNQTRYPTAFLCSDISRERLDRIDEALSRPGKQGLAALFALKSDSGAAPSSLEPAGGLGPLADAPVVQQGVKMEARREHLDLGEWLRRTELFNGLSTAEAAVLGTFMERRTAKTGETLVRTGEASDDLYLIESGHAEAQVIARTGERVTARMLGPGDYFGEIALITGDVRTADVVATEPMTLLRLGKDTYTRYLAHMAEVEQRLMRTVVERGRQPQQEPRHLEDRRDPGECFRQALPADAVVSDPAIIRERYLRNVTGLTRRVSLVLRPESEAEVIQIVSVANAHRIPLYPISRGKNWGLGSKLPVVNDSVVVDMGRMNRIVEVNEPFGYAILEPGVTQGELAAYLAEHHPSLTLNFTGSFAQTSIVGNVLERGDGAYGRVHDLLGVRGVLGNGTIFQTGGLWHHVGTDQPSHHSRYTAGPDLTGMFSQSSFGITTRMAFRLIHKPERYYVFWGAAPDANLESLVNAFDQLGRQGVINRGGVNIGYNNRFVQAVRTMRDDNAESQDADWNFYALVYGTARVADAAVEDVRTLVGPLCRSASAFQVGAGSHAYRELPQFLHPIVKPLLGSPDDESIRLIYEATSTPLPSDARDLDVDQTPFGMKCYIPIIPPRGEYARRVARIVSAVAAQFKLNVKFSLFGDGRGLITIHFRSDVPEQVRAAEGCEAALWNEMVRAGFPPYRASIDQMERLGDLQPELFKLIAQLKSVLDPRGILSPGRYAPGPTSGVQPGSHPPAR